jgi:hypothetical protein
MAFNQGMESGASVSLESILCTDELDRRSKRPPDYETENRALVSLAQALADSPRTILQTLADTILATCVVKVFARQSLRRLSEAVQYVVTKLALIGSCAKSVDWGSVARSR